MLKGAGGGKQPSLGARESRLRKRRAPCHRIPYKPVRGATKECMLHPEVRRIANTAKVECKKFLLQNNIYFFTGGSFLIPE